MSTAKRTRITADEYLRIERNSEIRSEFFRGEMFAMTGASRRHNLICANVLSSLHQQFKDRPCEVYQSDMRVKVNTSGLYTYPDVVATCKSPQFEDEQVDTLLNPQMIVEVLSDSTEAYDRGIKFGHYRNIESLQGYLLISQSEYRVERFSRQDDSQWLLWATNDPDEVVEIPSIDCRLSVSEIYARVEFEQGESESNSAASPE